MKLIYLLLLLFVFTFTFPVSFARFANNYSEKPIDGSVTSDSNGAENQIKFTRASVRGVGGAGTRSGGESNNGNGGQSNSSPGRGGGAVIPVYAAGSGAAAKTNNHHNAASICGMCQKDRLSILATITLLTSFLLHLSK